MPRATPHQRRPSSPNAAESPHQRRAARPSTLDLAPWPPTTPFVPRLQGCDYPTNGNGALPPPHAARGLQRRISPHVHQRRPPFPGCKDLTKASTVTPPPLAPRSARPASRRRWETHHLRAITARNFALASSAPSPPATSPQPAPRRHRRQIPLRPAYKSRCAYNSAPASSEPSLRRAVLVAYF
jgi:hypothetical protein